ncbi:MAG: GTP-binding protein [Candidatus Korarchaeota archaeon]|nr:GTP-binding protein [Candidatus Korarchaeota archaeon]NIU85453.1 GTP-binding protein [Candidatus Thorarchaeota archaeon]NIW15565.1 GTP-binding protein [Candidatus Thorarchaeota archaeon]NIW53506.1 GTP-binding protein [Candidatus Korarchaeota archaeon]
MKREADLRFKITMCGDYAVGKTSVCRRFTGKSFKKSYKATIGVDLYTKVMNVKNLVVNLQIWDLGGQARFEQILPSYFRGSNGSLVLFDLTRRETLKSISRWLKKVRNTAKSPTSILIGNKADLESLRSIDRSEAKTIQKKLGLEAYLETSAKENKNIDKAFRTLTEKTIDHIGKAY